MPLLKGKKNIGHNITVEEEHGKPAKQATAIALKTAGVKRAKDAMKCQCESSVCGGHGDGPCGNTATRDVPTIYGSYKMCRKCAEALPADFKKAKDDLQPVGVKRAKDDNDGPLIETKAGRNNFLMPLAKDDLQPVGSEDPERAIALKKHEEGVTKSQDRGKKMTRDVKPVGDKQARDLSGETLLSAAHEHAARGDADKALIHYDKAKKALLSEGKKDLAKEATEGARGAIKYGGASRAKDTELPTAVKPVGLVPLPSGEENEVSYAPRKVAQDEERDPEVELARKEWIKWVQRERKDPDNSHIVKETDKAEAAYMALKKKKLGVKDSKRGADSVIDPQSHLDAAVKYEIGQDRARALDSYRAAANGFRVKGDKPNEAKAEQAVRTALERTRAGETVQVVGKTVRPGRARDEAGTYDVGYMAGSKTRDITITASSWDEAMKKAKAGIQAGEELYRVSPRDKKATWAK